MWVASAVCILAFLPTAHSIFVKGCLHQHATPPKKDCLAPSEHILPRHQDIGGRDADELLWTIANASRGYGFVGLIAHEGLPIAPRFAPPPGLVWLNVTENMRVVQFILLSPHYLFTLSLLFCCQRWTAMDATAGACAGRSIGNEPPRAFDPNLIASTRSCLRFSSTRCWYFENDWSSAAACATRSHLHAARAARYSAVCSARAAGVKAGPKPLSVASSITPT